MAMASAPASRSLAMAARALPSSSGTRTRPSAAMRSVTSSRRWRGTSGAGESMKMSYMS